MNITATHSLASCSLLLSVACVAHAQQPPTLVSGPENYLPAVPSTVVEKDVAGAAPANANMLQPTWDGDKPFIPEMHAPQFPQPPMPQEMLDGFRPAAMGAFNLANVGILFAPVIQHHGDTLVQVSIDGVQRVVRLRPHTLREANARLIVQIEGGLLMDQAWPEPATYRGVVEGVANMDVAASIRHGEISMMLHPRDGGNPTWFIQPLSDGLPGMPPGLHVVYRDVDVIPSNAHCGWSDANPAPVLIAVGDPAQNRPALAERVQEQLAARPPAPLPEKSAPFGGDEGGLAGDGTLAAANVRCQLGIDCDVEFYQANGSSVVNTIYDMETVLNQVGLIYQNQVAISYTHNVLFVRTAEPDPYTSTNANTLLCQFGEWWNNNVTGARDVAHLFTGKDLDGTTVGLAWIGSICPTNFNNCNASGSSLSYGLVQSRFSTVMASRVQDSAHELGHNWNGCHCNTGGNCGGGTSNPVCGIMTSAISGQLTFDAAAVTAITTYRDGRACLEAWYNPVYVNNTWGGFENGSISNPFNTIFEGIDATLVNGTLVVQGGNYFQNPNIFKAKTIQAVNGTVRIGN